MEAAKEDLYEVFEEVRCPTMMATCRNNCPNEKPGGLAQNIFKFVTNYLKYFHKLCKFFVVPVHLERNVNLQSSRI